MINIFTPPTTRYLRLSQIIGTLAASQSKKLQHNRASELPVYPPLIPVSKSTWWAGVKSGRYPQPVRTLGPRITVWRAEDIFSMLEDQNS